MPVHPKIQAILDLPADPNEVPVEDMDPVQAREAFEKDLIAADAAKPAVRDIRDAEVQGAVGKLAARIYRPSGGAAQPAMVYFHGGGYIRGSIETHDSSCRILANSSGATVVSVAYRLAPEAKFPEPLEDCYAATADIAARAAEFDIDPARLAVGGDSAGGNFAAGVVMLARDRAGPELKFQLLIYPNLDLGAATESVRLYSSGYMLNSMPFYVASYTRGPADIADPLCSPLAATDLGGLPAAYILTCGYDPLRDEGRAFARRLRDAGVAVEEVCHDDMIHGFLLLRAIVQDEADAALVACGQALGRGLAM
jgi:acetyl esterase